MHVRSSNNRCELHRSLFITSSALWARLTLACLLSQSLQLSHLLFANVSGLKTTLFGKLDSLLHAFLVCGILCQERLYLALKLLTLLFRGLALLFLFLSCNRDDLILWNCHIALVFDSRSINTSSTRHDLVHIHVREHFVLLLVTFLLLRDAVQSHLLIMLHGKVF